MERRHRHPRGSRRARGPRGIAWATLFRLPSIELALPAEASVTSNRKPARTVPSSTAWPGLIRPHLHALAVGASRTSGRRRRARGRELLDASRLGVDWALDCEPRCPGDCRAADPGGAARSRCSSRCTLSSRPSGDSFRKAREIAYAARASSGAGQDAHPRDVHERGSTSGTASAGHRRRRMLIPRKADEGGHKAARRGYLAAILGKTAPTSTRTWAPPWARKSVSGRPTPRGDAGAGGRRARRGGFRPSCRSCSRASNAEGRGRLSHGGRGPVARRVRPGGGVAAGARPDARSVPYASGVAERRRHGPLDPALVMDGRWRPLMVLA